MKLNAKYVVFSMIGLASAYVIYHNERFVVQPKNPAWQHYAPFKWWLLPHARNPGGVDDTGQVSCIAAGSAL